MEIENFLKFHFTLSISLYLLSLLNMTTYLRYYDKFKNNIIELIIFYN